MEDLTAVSRLTRDLVKASVTLSDDEARYLVDAYYLMQESRKRTDNQVLAMKAEPHTLLAWFAEQNTTLENQIKRALESYSSSKPVGEWMKSQFGIGPIIAAGLMAHIDIEQSPTVGHIWRFAGLDPTSKWDKGEKRPWNASLKTLCWKIGQSFMKFSGNEECVYGAVYRERKTYEIARNDIGFNAERCAQILQDKKFNKDTDAYKAYIAGKLPPAHVDAQARRYAVKLFLSHLHLIWYWVHYKKVVPKPYAMAILGHAHFIDPPNLEMFPELVEALKG